MAEVSCMRAINLSHSIWNTEVLPQQWKEAIIIPINKRSNKTYFSNCQESLKKKKETWG
jgi:hypothetical protein